MLNKYCCHERFYHPNSIEIEQLGGVTHVNNIPQTNKNENNSEHKFAKVVVGVYLKIKLVK